MPRKCKKAVKPRAKKLDPRKLLLDIYLRKLESPKAHMIVLHAIRYIRDHPEFAVKLKRKELAPI